MTRHSYRSPVSGRWARVPTELARDERSDRFPQTDSIEVGFQGADPRDLAYDMVGRDESSAGPKYYVPRVQDDLGIKGSPLRARRPEMVPGNERAETSYYTNGRDVPQGAVSRAAAKDSGPMDPSFFLTHGA